MTATVLLLLVPLSASAPPEPVSEQTIAAWVADLRGEDSTKQREAYEALLKAGPKAKSAVPALTKFLGEKGARYDYAAEILGAIGPDANSAVPALMALLPKESGGFGHGTERIAYALAQIDGPKIEATRVLLLSHTKGNEIFLTVSGTLHQYPEKVVPQLITLCADKDAVVRAKAAYVLGILKEKPVAKVVPPSLYEKAGDSTKDIPATLEKLLADKNSDVQLAAAQAITHVAPELTDKALACVVALAEKYQGMIKHGIHAHGVFHPVPEKAAKVLIPLFDHSRDTLRNWAIDHASALPLRESIEDALKNGTTARTRQAAAIALGSRYGSGADAVPALTAALKDSEFIVRFAAGVALINIGRRGNPANAVAIPVLIEGLQQKDAQVRLQASLYLLQAGPVAKDAIPALKKLLDEEKPTVRLEAALALVGIDKKEATGTVPALTEGLKLGDGPAIRAAKALAELGSSAKDAMPELVKHFDAKNPHLRLNSVAAAALIDPAHAPKAVEVLTGLLKDKKNQTSMIRSYALVALQKIGPGAKPALPTLTELLKDDGPFHADAALAMVAIDPDSKNPAFEWIRTALVKSPDEDGYEVMERLSELGAKAKPLVPELTALLKSKGLYYRKTAITTLGAIGPDAKDALPELKQQAEKDPRKDIRELAAAAIKKIEAK